jgi:hypothetical protein
MLEIGVCRTYFYEIYFAGIPQNGSASLAVTHRLISTNYISPEYLVGFSISFPYSRFLTYFYEIYFAEIRTF